jgi:hypothetical protein
MLALETELRAVQHISGSPNDVVQALFSIDANPMRLSLVQGHIPRLHSVNTGT